MLAMTVSWSKRRLDPVPNKSLKYSAMSNFQPNLPPNQKISDNLFIADLIKKPNRSVGFAHDIPMPNLSFKKLNKNVV